MIFGRIRIFYLNNVWCRQPGPCSPYALLKKTSKATVTPDRIVRLVVIWRTCDRSAMFATISRSGRILRSVFFAGGRSSSMMLGMRGGARKRGRPRALWLDDIKAVTNYTLIELCGLTRDRDAWRKMVMGITRSRTRLDGKR